MPYRKADTPEKQKKVTQALLNDHPLKANEICDAVLEAWNTVWNTTIGTGAASITLREIDPPATIIGYMLEKVLAKMLSAKYPGVWRGGSGSEKDLHCLTNGKHSVEMKSSGQLGLKIFGNRSYGQKLERDSKAKKDKSGYYITVNFYGQSINLIRFGWIDGDDWLAQKAASGQMSGLKPEVYLLKLVPIRGNYVLNAPIELLDGLGPKSVQELNLLGYQTIKDLLQKAAPKIRNNLYEKAKAAADIYAKNLS